MSPEHYPHAMCFREICLLLLNTLRTLGYTCEFGINRLERDRINIVVGYHLIEDPGSLDGHRVVIYQLEQLEAANPPARGHLLDTLRRANIIWDYSGENVAWLRDNGLEAIHLVPGYHPGLHMVHPKPNRAIDVLFYGSIGDRRKRILDDLARRFKVKTLFGIYGEQRDRWIERSKIILNMHHYPTHIFEVVRVSYLLNNGCFVVNETSVHNPYRACGLVEVPYEVLADTCAHYLGLEEERQISAKSSMDAFESEFPMTRLLSETLEDSSW